MQNFSSELLYVEMFFKTDKIFRWLIGLLDFLFFGVGFFSFFYP
ncbi:hypothetical protein M153_16000012109 [Pseudoloma neurophilia]|uniref:Uncharacterized protein n=1 Tax=Pseudoloma neurophilia TaxID=146866 RepID=A0A0R0M5N1_9MICR|nr:hypothetical protein M153_16000012109 [Pseudoloma neurophilia]